MHGLGTGLPVLSPGSSGHVSVLYARRPARSRNVARIDRNAEQGYGRAGAASPPSIHALLRAVRVSDGDRNPYRGQSEPMFGKLPKP
ncbi:hypothetical protein L210DRAFT_944688 [Boletus edulis BED1]|uniref:Uncharacterized protein n=1 Tax=Boletus edulis BED1 TaxID=1328754 RepID=A0AAD4BUK3_BOLED|nr:hypothetical protein L210DRAFT_944688 [Boletus edulis BED1]